MKIKFFIETEHCCVISEEEHARGVYNQSMHWEETIVRKFDIFVCEKGGNVQRRLVDHTPGGCSISIVRKFTILVCENRGECTLI